MGAKNLFDFDHVFEKNLVDFHNDMSSRVIKLAAKIKFENKLKREKVEQLFSELPAENESLHIVSNGTFDYFTLIPHVIAVSNSQADEFWFSTWTMSRENVIQIVDLFDRGYMKTINALTGEYFRTRESKVFSLLDEACSQRGQRLTSNKNHAKVTLLKIGDGHFIIEGSANFTANPRIEQFVLTNSKPLFDFHKEWMNLILNKK